MKRFTMLIVIITILSATACSQAAEQPSQNGPIPSVVTAATSVVTSPSPTPAAAPSPSPTPAALSALPKDYNTQTAADNGDYVEVHGSRFYNEDILTAFLGSVYSKKQAAIRLVSYTTEGDPIITDVSYDGSSFTVL